MLRIQEMPSREGTNIKPIGSQTFPRLYNLIWLGAYLIKQEEEGVVIITVSKGDVDGRVAEGFCSLKAAKPRSDYDDFWSVRFR